MKLNGWQRLWVVAAVVWSLVCLVVVVGLGVDDWLGFMVYGWVTPAIAVYALGWGIGWALRGFRHQ